MKAAVWKACVTLAVLIAPGLAAMSSAEDLTKIKRSIFKEPRYAAKPHYSLLVIGPKAEHRLWIVMDGNEALYFDRNGNGDLTDAEDCIKCDTQATKQVNIAPNSSYSGMNVFPIGIVAGVKLRLDFWVRNREYVATDEWLKGILHERDVNKWENATLWRLTEEEGQAQIPVLLTATPADAQITHLGGPLVFALKRDAKQKLEPWPKATIFDVHIGTRSLPPRNCNHDLFAPLTEWEVPRDLHPVAHFTFQPKTPGAASVELNAKLDQRCCGDTMYAEMRVPHAAGEGHVKVTLSYAAWKDRSVQTTTFEIPISKDPSEGDAAQSFVMFKSSSKSGLEGALAALREQGLTVFKTAGEPMSECVTLSLKEKGSIAIRLKTGADVLETSLALGQGTPLETALANSDARYEITLYPATLVSEAKESISKAHAALLAESKGVLYTTWDKQLSGAAK